MGIGRLSRALGLRLQQRLGARSRLELGVLSRLLQLGPPVSFRAFDLLTGAHELRVQPGIRFLLDAGDLCVVLTGERRLGIGTRLESGGLTGSHGVNRHLPLRLPRLFCLGAQARQFFLEAGVGRSLGFLGFGLELRFGSGQRFAFGFELGQTGYLLERRLLAHPGQLGVQAGFCFMLDPCDLGFMLAGETRFGFSARLPRGGLAGGHRVDGLALLLGLPSPFSLTGLFRLLSEPCQFLLQAKICQFPRALGLGAQHGLREGIRLSLGVESSLLELGLAGQLRALDLLLRAGQLFPQSRFGCCLDASHFGFPLPGGGGLGGRAGFERLRFSGRRGFAFHVALDLALLLGLGAHTRELFLQTEVSLLPHAFGLDLHRPRGSLLGGDDGVSGSCLAGRLEIPLRLLLGQARLFRFLPCACQLCLDARGGFLADAGTLGFRTRALEFVAQLRIAFGLDSGDLSVQREASRFLGGQSSPLDLGQSNSLGLLELRGQTLLGLHANAFELRLELLLGFGAGPGEFFGQRTSRIRLSVGACLVDLLVASCVRLLLQTGHLRHALRGGFAANAFELCGERGLCLCLHQRDVRRVELRVDSVVASRFQVDVDVVVVGVVRLGAHGRGDVEEHEFGHAARHRGRRGFDTPQAGSRHHFE